MNVYQKGKKRINQNRQMKTKKSTWKNDRILRFDFGNNHYISHAYHPYTHTSHSSSAYIFIMQITLKVNLCKSKYSLNKNKWATRTYLRAHTHTFIFLASRNHRHRHIFISSAHNAFQIRQFKRHSFIYYFIRWWKREKEIATEQKMCVKWYSNRWIKNYSTNWIEL